MSTPKIIRATQKLLRQVIRTSRNIPKAVANWLLRGLILIGRRATWSSSGFILPATVMLILVVTLTVGAISYRTYTRSQQTIGERQQRVIYNAATPAIDRARAKLEFLFDNRRDPRGGAVPSEGTLLGMLYNDGRPVKVGGSETTVPKFKVAGTTDELDPYTFPGEQRLDLNGDGRPDNAWQYQEDANGNGQTNDPEDAIVAYSIIFRATDENTPGEVNLRDQRIPTLRTRATNQQVRNAPLSNATLGSLGCNGGSATNRRVTLQEQGWFQDPNQQNLIRKNFQVNAFVQPNDQNGTVSTLEFQQDRQATRGFKWAVWFRNDLEVFPGPQFNVNGSVHTEGSLIATRDTGLRFYMISAPTSCLYTRDASEITVANTRANPEQEIPAFQGQYIIGSLRNNNKAGTVSFDLWRGASTTPNSSDMTDTNDSVVATPTTPVIYALDPVELYTRDNSVARGLSSTVSDGGGYLQGNPADTSNNKVSPDWKTSTFNQDGNGRLLSATQPTPYVDDAFRADDRYGPKARYGTEREQIEKFTGPRGIGQEITNSSSIDFTGLGTVSDTKPEDTTVGLDGYWERRARNEGLRVVVGQRLELGDLAGWGGPDMSGIQTSDTSERENNAIKRTIVNEPLRPWAACPPLGNVTRLSDLARARCNERRQLRTLWDNLAAVQATVVYHGKHSDKDFPVACFATTVHPGTAATLARSATFEPLAPGLKINRVSNDRILSDFFRGRGTNGWEYEMPPLSQFTDSNSELMKALKNLGYFAGDPMGGSPSFEVKVTGEVHPFPSMAMWGDFSILRNILIPYGDRKIKAYADLSPADKTTLHSAGCMLSMLAYNVNYLNRFDYSNPDNAAEVIQLNQRLRELVEGNSAVPTQINKNNAPFSEIAEQFFKLIPSSGKLDFTGSRNKNNPENIIRLLEYWRDLPQTATTIDKTKLNQLIYLAQLIATKEQVERDRLFGFDGMYIAGQPRDTVSRQCNAWLKSDNEDEKYLGLLCSSRPRFPILYSLFPLADHGDRVGGTTQSIQQGANDSDGPLFRLRQEAEFPTGDIGIFTNRTFGEARDLEEEDLPRTPGTPRTKGVRYFDDVNGAGALGREPAKLYEYVDVSKLAEFGGPKRVSEWLDGKWATSSVASAPGNGTTPNNSQSNLIKYCDSTTDTPCYKYTRSTQRYRIPFKDAAFFNGRELMSVRALDIDLDMIRKRSFGSNDFWLPKSGIVYAFREDAVSEANIVRPETKSWDDCGKETVLNSIPSDITAFRQGCQMRTESLSAWDSKDPPVFRDNSITVKPVDYYPDPDRRPHGFRLKNGVAVWRTDSGALSERGLSFITDNPAYVQGAFNLHQRRGATGNNIDQLWEFTEELNSTYSNFYSRSTLDTTGFVKQEGGVWQDQWRPSEVLADAVTLLSSNFCDGSIEDGLYHINQTGGIVLPDANYVNTRYGCLAQESNSNKTSYYNQSLPTNFGFTPRPTTGTTNTDRFARTNYIESYLPSRNGSTFEAPGSLRSVFEPESPIVIGRGGVPFRQSNVTGAVERMDTIAYEGRSGGRRLIAAPNETQMNLILVSGLVPSRALQSYGGLHNFPRFLEDWNTNLRVNGALVQLNFSTYATAPFDQERWQPSEGIPGSEGEFISYYDPPGRRWGYDVGLQFVPPGPVAERFKTAERVRGEFYSEPPANDPYIVNLCTQIRGAGNCPT